ncbi:bifunctional phosphopantothenoylcysteine decarboxylase/phosphopantothenate--cysteine ligase CoaBC [Candidatus Acetothermia bacterium]|nr:bifunctional phosphopantothenoylcysteine decarboxylase/phosphopantothenate--cysteine ligase CoaBC [Candidatus Acetothermia bacterium]MBI3642579.1 bifunctional phosphopantothenoylcysteine decarboxylase/phosphopantothenate--cysteine ligase CoaBC [Candidatus Acetothermia bacterium]
MAALANRRIVAGICGGIAAYKAAGVVSKLYQAQANIRVIMTHAACQFVTPLTFEALSHQRVLSHLFRDEPLAHVELAHEADLIVVMPATYDIIGKVAYGLADDYLTATIPVTKAPVLFVPAMESQMYENPIFEENKRKLEALGYRFLEPESGNLASGRKGIGRFPSEEAILQAIEEILVERTLFQGRKILVTAGPTRERIDPMRLITNRSSGKMGYALAEAARDFGAKVVLISGPTQLAAPVGIECIDVESAEEMKDAVLSQAPLADIVIMTAAVADWRPLKTSSIKESKLADEILNLALRRTPDILTEVAKKLKGRKQKPLMIGFAAETGDLLEKAQGKLKRKNLDMIVANDLSQEGAGAEVDTNIVTLIYKNGKRKPFPKMTKRLLAKEILREIAKI